MFMMSALLPKADIPRRRSNVRLGPKAAVSRCNKNPLFKASLFDHLVGAAGEGQRDIDAECLGGL
jgi:hypothetical protein